MDSSNIMFSLIFISALWLQSSQGLDAFPVKLMKFVNSSTAMTHYDSVIIVGESWQTSHYSAIFAPYLQEIQSLSMIDASVSDDITVFTLQSLMSPSPKLGVWSPTGPVTRDYDDVRLYKEAAIKGMKRALKAGKKNPLVAVYSSEKQRTSEKFKDALQVSLLGALEGAYVPIEVRERSWNYSGRVDSIGFSSIEIKTEEAAKKLMKFVLAVEHSRVVARDIAGSDPERMAPGRVEEYLKNIFADSSIDMEVTSGQESFLKDYPLFAAVDRCANTILRHRGRIIQLEYTGENVNKTYLFIGKGVTYDTGGADLKTDNDMIGMHRDKSGAAAVAGLFVMLKKLKPKGVKVIGRLPLVRNSIGADCYLADEIITSAAGVNVRVKNTDAEGRMAMADSLFYSKQQALKEINPHIFTVATLTGHASLAMGNAYSVVMDNGPAKKEDFAQHLQAVGEQIADPFEISSLRREDFQVVEGKFGYEDVFQSVGPISTKTDRGHQYPMAFMIRASGLDKHGYDSSQPLKYSHIDIGGPEGKYPGIPTAAPIPVLAKLILRSH